MPKGEKRVRPAWKRAGQASHNSQSGETDWAKLYGQPENPRTPESYARECESSWNHWRSIEEQTRKSPQASERQQEHHGTEREQYGTEQEQYGTEQEQYGTEQEQYGTEQEQYGTEQEQYEAEQVQSSHHRRVVRDQEEEQPRQTREAEQQEIEGEADLAAATSAKGNGEAFPTEARLRRRKTSRSGSSSNLFVPESAKYRRSSTSAEAQKRWSRPPPPDDNSSIQQTLLIILTFVMIAITLGGCAVLYRAAEHSHVFKVSRSDLMPTFDQKLTELRAQFPTQPKHNWGIIRAAFAEVLNSSQYEYGPAVLVVLASKKDQHLASCFAGKLAATLARTFNPTEEPIHLNGGKLSLSHDSVVAKHAIDNAVRGRDNFVMQFDSLEQIDAYTATIFHSLCDYYNSPFHERAVFIFTLHTSDEVEGRLRKEYDKMADKVLNEVWDELDLNKRSALIARLTGSTILLRRESRRVC